MDLHRNIHLTHYNWVMPYGIIDILAIIGLGNGLVPNRHQAITWTNDDLCLLLTYDLCLILHET